MFTDFTYARLKGLARADDAAGDGAGMPPEVFAAWRRAGTVFGKFVLLGELGRGGTSVVHRAWQADLKREVALKVVTGLDPDLRERFEREARVGARLSHPGILPVFESGESGGSLWLSMPLVAGETLDRCELGAVAAARAVAEAARAVEAAHAAGIVHRDLKPRNVMRDAHGIRVMDFGLARDGGETVPISQAGQVLGTPQYMSPEQAAGRPADARSDVYGLGATLYRLLTGRAPYAETTLPAFLGAIAARGADPVRDDDNVPAALHHVLETSMQREPHLRYPTAAALADDLERFARGEPVLAQPGSRTAKAGRTVRRTTAWIAAAAVAAVAVSIAAREAVLSAGTTDQGLAAENGGPSNSLKHLLSPLDRSLAEAEELRKQGEVTAAIALFTEILRRHPTCSPAWAARGACHAEKHEWGLAESDFTEAMRHPPFQTLLWWSRGQARMYSGNLDGALADYDDFVRARPDDPDGYIGRSRIHALRSQWNLALQECNTAVARGPDNIWARTARAVLFYQMERFAESVADYDEAIRISGAQPPLLRARGRSKLKAGDLAGALGDLERAVAMDQGLADQCAEEMSEARAGLRETAPE